MMNIKEELSKLNNWALNENQIEKEFIFKDFHDAIAFIVKISIEAERINHHPEIYNVYNKVRIILTTYNIGRLSELDFALAKFIDNKI